MSTRIATGKRTDQHRSASKIARERSRSSASTRGFLSIPIYRATGPVRMFVNHPMNSGRKQMEFAKVTGRT